MLRKETLKVVQFYNNLTKFIAESNRIEGINRPVTDAERELYAEFLGLKSVTIANLQIFVSKTQKGAEIRDRPGLDVKVGNHVAPIGGMQIVDELDLLLIFSDKNSPYQIHLQYEQLHPFTDGNGRSGRLLWLWCMKNDTRENDAVARKMLFQNALERGFLHSFYYQTLSEIKSSC